MTLPQPLSLLPPLSPALGLPSLEVLLLAEGELIKV